VGFWDIFKNWIFLAIYSLYNVFDDWGIAIIVMTIIFRMLLMPITVKQSNSAYKVQKMQPRIKEIQEKYADDRVRQGEELNKIYKETNYNPFTGCLPVLLQLPLFGALFNVLKNLPAWITEKGQLDEGFVASFLNIVPDLSLAPSNVFAFSASAFLAALPYLIMLLLFGLSMIIPMLLNPNKDSTSMMMLGGMSIMMMFTGWGAPAGVLLYWDVSSLIGIGQQLITKAVNERRDAVVEKEQIDIRPVKVNVERKDRKNRPRKSR